MILFQQLQDKIKQEQKLKKITKSNQLKKIGDLYNKMKSEKKRIKDLLK